jgi:hypothetical protein
MFVMVMSVRRSNTVFHTETVSEDKININHTNLNNNSLIKSINSINTHLQIIKNKGSDKNSFDKNIKRISSVDSSTILSPTALTAAQNSAQSPTNKFLLTELNNYRKPPTTTIQVSVCVCSVKVN